VSGRGHRRRPGAGSGKEAGTARVRSFVAIELPEEVRRALGGVQEEIRARLVRGGTGAERARSAPATGGRSARSGRAEKGPRFVKEASLHVTLRFLGSIDRSLVPCLVEALRRELAGVPPLRLVVGGLRVFPSAARPRVLSVDLKPLEPLGELAGDVERAVQSVGLPAEDRPFRAHLTLARLPDGLPAALRPRPGAEDDAALPEIPVPEVELPVEEVVLFESRLGPGGAVYQPLARVPLAGARAGAAAAGEPGREGIGISGPEEGGGRASGPIEATGG